MKSLEWSWRTESGFQMVPIFNIRSQKQSYHHKHPNVLLSGGPIHDMQICGVTAMHQSKLSQVPEHVREMKLLFVHSSDSKQAHFPKCLSIPLICEQLAFTYRGKYGSTATTWTWDVPAAGLRRCWEWETSWSCTLLLALSNKTTPDT